jgi:hypothetical protein
MLHFPSLTRTENLRNPMPNARPLGMLNAVR